MQNFSSPRNTRMILHAITVVECREVSDEQPCYSKLQWLTWLSIRSLVSSPGMSMVTLVSLFIPLPSLSLSPLIITNSLRPTRRDWDRRATPLSSPAPEENEYVYCFFPKIYLSMRNDQTGIKLIYLSNRLRNFIVWKVKVHTK